MNFLGDVIEWFTQAGRFAGVDGITHRVFEHLQLSVLAIVCAAIIALPAGAFLGHVKRGGLVATSIVNIGRAIPSFAIVAIALPITIRFGLGFGFWPTWLAVFVLAMPPMFTNTYTAIRDADPQATSAARGMGLTEREVLLSVEWPLALPLILAAVRVSSVQVVATATLGALVGWGGLGRFIVDGLAVRDFAQVFAGAFLVAALAVATELAFSVAERFVVPRGLRAQASSFVARPI